MTSSQITQKLNGLAFVSSNQPLSKRWMEEHVGVVDPFHQESSEHLKSLQKVSPLDGTFSQQGIHRVEDFFQI